MFVAEAVKVFAVHSSGEGVVAVGYGAFVELESPLWICYLAICQFACHRHVRCQRHTQKSISRFPLPPNSRSPTWKVTVILSSACNCSWKHSLECARSWILCARDERANANSETMRDINNMMGNVCFVECSWKRCPFAVLNGQKKSSWLGVTNLHIAANQQPLFFIPYLLASLRFYLTLKMQTGLA
jgi:hypothetical protein